MKKIINLAVLISLILTLTGCGAKVDKSQSAYLLNAKANIVGMPGLPSSPKHLFSRAWSAIDRQFVDESHNNQNWEKWKNRYSDKIESYEDAYVAIDTMVESLNDPYTIFLDPKEFKEQNTMIDSKITGIGIHITQLKGITTVVNVMENTPAAKAGLEAEDGIEEVDGKDVKGLDLHKVADMIRGPIGKEVTLKIKRNKMHLTKIIKRAEIKIKSVEFKELDKDMGYIKLSTFLSMNTAEEFEDALDALKDKKGLIVDLRGNFGGLLENAELISNMFISEGTIVSIVDKNGKKDTISALKGFEPAIKKPLVVLIDGSSASASEILSGALKDHGRATLVGETTFGKGKVQRVSPLPNEAGINITIAKYLTPAGHDIDKKGVKPDIEVKRTKEQVVKKIDPQLEKAIEVLAAKMN